MGKCGLCVRLTTLPPPCDVVMKSENLNFLEPFGPLQACNGTDLLMVQIQTQTVIDLSSYLYQESKVNCDVSFYWCCCRCSHTIAAGKES